MRSKVSGAASTAISKTKKEKITMVIVKTYNAGEKIAGEIYGQYNLDVIDGNEQDPYGQRQARDMPSMAMHGDDVLFDQASLHIPDEATGQTMGSEDELSDYLLDETTLDHIANPRTLDTAMGMKGDLTAQWIQAIESGDTSLAQQIEAQMLR